MRGLRSTIILLAVALGLGAYIYFVESKRPSSSEAAAAKQKALTIPPDKIEQLTIKSAGGDTTMLAKVNGAWELTAPVTAAADPTTVSSITSSVNGLDIQRVVEENPSDLKQYGLDPPRVEVTVKTADDKNPQRLLLGQKTATGGDLYAKLENEKRVLLISASLDDSFNKGTFDLRDKTVLKIDAVGVDKVEIAAGGQAAGASANARNVQLAKRGLQWHMTQPLDTEADLGIVSGLTTTLTSLQMRSVAANDVSDLATYGLDRPAWTVTVGAGSALATLLIGTKADESSVYARDLSRPIVFTIDSSVVDDVKKEPWEFRRKDVFDFQTLDATRLELTRGGPTAVYEKTKGSDKDPQEKWRQMSPATRDIDKATIDAAIEKLSYLRATAFVDRRKAATGLERATMSVVVTSEDGKTKKEERVKLSTAGDRAYAARADWPDAATLDANAYALLVKAIDDLQR